MSASARPIPAYLPSRWAEYFDRLCSPKPVLYVFPGIEGIAFDRTEDPSTRRLILGMSSALYVTVRNRMFAETGDQLEARVDVRWESKASRSVTLDVVAGGYKANCGACPECDGPHRVVPTVTLTLTPKPLTL